MLCLVDCITLQRPLSGQWRMYYGVHSKEMLGYLDDEFILGKTFQEHLNSLKTVFIQFRETTLKLNLEKRYFLQIEVKCLVVNIHSHGQQFHLPVDDQRNYNKIKH